MHPKEPPNGFRTSNGAGALPRAIELVLRVSHREQLGNCFIPFHFREAAANLLTIDEIDPVGKIPEFKFCAVQVEQMRRTSSEAAPSAETGSAATMSGGSAPT